MWYDELFQVFEPGRELGSNVALKNFRVTVEFQVKISQTNLGLCHILPTKQRRRGGYKTEGSNTIMSKTFALKFWTNKIFDVDITLSITLAVS